FLNRQRTKELFRAIFRRGKESAKRGKKWKFTQSPLFLDFLAGNQTYACTPWGNPTRNVFGWQRPCYLLGEGYAKSFKELMETTDWDRYGVGNYEKCSDCMVHSGFEATAVMDSIKRPWKIAQVALGGIKTEGAMAKDIPLDKARKADFNVFTRHVESKMAEIHAEKAARQAALPAE
ncbi:MAG: DUF3463 domain-containing protein, partial [Rhodospirillales bacterium]|nr:DUF3463 domain-containing protein [Rhodospirillales bacterium]